MRFKPLLFLIAFAAMSAPLLTQTKGNSADQYMLFRSYVQDDPECLRAFADAGASERNAVTSPAATCPDAFAWLQLLSSIREEFWTWGTDQTTWPEKPHPLCRPGQTESCCDRSEMERPGALPPVHCPYDRADYPGKSPIPAVPAGSANKVIINHGPLTTVERLDPGRLLRDLELEIVFRNKAMIHYLFVHDLYNREGLGARVRATNQATGEANLAVAHGLEVRLPTGAIMVKVDFVSQAIMQDEHLIQATDRDGKPLDPPNNPDYPYLTAWFEGKDGPKDPTTGYYYLLAMTNSSKALPGWHWYAIEHVANRGRCDYVGCNDSFGYRVNPTSPNGAVFGTHFIPPKLRLENDKTRADDPVFVTGEVYDPKDTGEVMTESLAALYRAFGVATAKVDEDPRVLAPQDPAWRNYRLKGTQTQFTTSTGIPTGTGATITEGGFVNSASCMTCHSQATVDETGGIGIGGVGSTWRLNLFGFNQVVMGAPDDDWFFDPGTTTYDALQIDFIWGILNAQCVTPAASGSGCASYPSKPGGP